MSYKQIGKKKLQELKDESGIGREIAQYWDDRYTENYNNCMKEKSGIYEFCSNVKTVSCKIKNNLKPTSTSVDERNDLYTGNKIVINTIANLNEENSMRLAEKLTNILSAIIYFAKPLIGVILFIYLLRTVFNWYFITFITVLIIWQFFNTKGTKHNK
jgi:hypothetical protein